MCLHISVFMHTESFMHLCLTPEEAFGKLLSLPKVFPEVTSTSFTRVVQLVHFWIGFCFEHDPGSSYVSIKT